MRNNEPVPIQDVPAYSKALAGGLVPWWAGDRTDINGYYITNPDSGGKYCDVETNYGQTAVTETLEQADDGSPVVQKEKKTVVTICPNGFNNIKQPEEYESAVRQIEEGNTLEDAVPRSATFLHEGFHIFFGSGPSGMLEGKQEFCELMRAMHKSI